MMRMGKIALEIAEVINFRERSLKTHTIKEYLVKWKELLVEDVTWESALIFEYPNLE